MKHTFAGMQIALALVLAVVLGAVALAENAEPELTELPATEQAQPEAPSTDASADSAALREAFKRLQPGEGLRASGGSGGRAERL